MPRQHPPTAVAHDYFKMLQELLLEAKSVVLAALRSALGSRVRFDAPGDDANRAMDRASEQFFERLRPERVESLARTIAERTSRYQKEQLDRQVKATFGVDVLRAEPDLARKSSGFVSENVALIKSIPNQYFDRVEAVVTRGINAAATPDQLAADIEREFEVSESRARLIARDQVGKYFAQVNQTRQEDLGVTHYIWRTVQDARVREGHLEREGERFSWDEVPPDAGGGEGHPGEPIQCRCYADPDLSPILEEV